MTLGEFIMHPHSIVTIALLTMSTLLVLAKFAIS
jgi:hypothetical protein